MNIISLFSGAGGLDLGFKQTGFKIVWANEYDKDIWQTYEANHPETILDKRSIVDIPSSEIPDCDGMIGGPPCQSWSVAGSLRDFEDTRGRLFYEFIRVLNDKQPKFFLVENVSGMLTKRHQGAMEQIQFLLKQAGTGYNLSFELLNAAGYNVPQDRNRVFFVGIRRDLDFSFQFPKPKPTVRTLYDAIEKLKENALPVNNVNYSNDQRCALPNHEFMTGGFSSLYMSRNRVRSWDEPSFTIQASGRHVPIHPNAPKMERIDRNNYAFVKGQERMYRRLSVRECARVQTFPDEFIFYYTSINAGYKMIGNAVPVNLARCMAISLKDQLKK